MNSGENYAEIIREIILRTKKPSYQTTNKKEVRIRCPYCGDSKSNPTSAHLYIEMTAPFRFHCFKCETSGVLNQEAFRDMGLFDSELALSVVSANKERKNNSGIQKVSFKKQMVKNNVFETDATLNSLQYFNNRFHSNYTADFVKTKFKAVLDPIMFFNENRITPNVQFDFTQSIGFLSSDNSHVIFRDYGGKQDKRYNNLNIAYNENEGTISKTYNISSNISAMEPDVNLVIAEGVFDIIGVYTHFYRDNDYNTIFAAACGKAYNAVISNYIRMGFLNLNVIIYSDADVDPSFYRALKNNAPYLKNSKITVFYNNLYDPKTKYGKDYGCPKEDIQLRKIII
jgi:hypothetical protein